MKSANQAGTSLPQRICFKKAIASINAVLPEPFCPYRPRILDLYSLLLFSNDKEPEVTFLKFFILTPANRTITSSIAFLQHFIQSTVILTLRTNFCQYEHSNRYKKFQYFISLTFLHQSSEINRNIIFFRNNEPCRQCIVLKSKLHTSI